MTASAHERTIDMLGRLINVPSPTGNEQAISLVLAAMMKESGYDEVIVDENHNVVGMIDSGKAGKTVLLLNHSDSAAAIPDGTGDLYTVVDGKPFGKDGMCVSGPGAVSPKSAITSILLAAEKLAQNKDKFAGKVKIAIVTKDLFCNHDGTREAAPLINDADIAVTAEPSHNEIITCARGILQFKVSFLGKPTHWAVADQRYNAFYPAAFLINLLKDVPAIEDERFGLTGYNPVKIEYAATAPHIPKQVDLIIDCRILPGESVDGAIAKLNELTALAGKEFPEAEPRAAVISNMYPFRTAGLEHELDVLSAAAEKALGREVKRVPLKCATNAAFIREELNIPALVFGCGDLGDMVGGEMIALKEIEAAAAVYYQFVVDFQAL